MDSLSKITPLLSDPKVFEAQIKVETFLSSSVTQERCLLAPSSQAKKTIKERKMDLNEARDSCDYNIRKYNQLLRR